MAKYTFHLIPNAHLDPAWLWDWREGLTEGIITCRTILDLMDEDEDLTFIRGEAAIYDHIERNDPKTFKRIAKYVAKGRWDVVGGTWIQPDTNLPATETLARHYAVGQNYFESRFGNKVRVAWAADSFGHAAGIPEILVSAGIESIAFTRPPAKVLPIAKPAFWWQGSGGSRVLAYRPTVGWYGSDRDESPRRLDALLAGAEGYGLETIGFFFGLGDHGGGPTRRHLADIRAWADTHKSQVRIVFSGLHRFFDALRSEVKRKGEKFIPTHQGEMNFALRGCSVSVAKYKFLYRKTEAALACAERTDAAVSALVDHKNANLRRAWTGLLFNSFHDILPGSSIERVYDDQIPWTGGVYHEAQLAELNALTSLSLQVDTRVTVPADPDHPTPIAAIVWNPHPHPFKGHIELEGSLDYRPIWSYQNRVAELPIQALDHAGKPISFQAVDTETLSLPTLAWRRRSVLPVEIPAMGWTFVEMGWIENPRLAQPPESPAHSPKPGVIDNGIYRVSASVGDEGISIERYGKSIFSDGKGLSAMLFDDPWGSWGGMSEEPESFNLTKVLERWKITQVESRENGPERATIWVKLSGGKSRIELTISVYHGRDAVDAQARVTFDERSARLKLVMPGADKAEYDVPGASVVRGAVGEVPGGRWVRALDASGAVNFGFASDALYGFDVADGEYRASIVRASRYAETESQPAEALPWRPASDSGELRFRFLISPGDERLPRLADELEQPPTVFIVPAKKGKLPREGSALSLSPSSLQLLAFKPAESGRGYVLRVRETSGKSVKPKLTWLGKTYKLDKVEGGTLATWRLVEKKTGWQIKITDTTEG
jgi:alpha-mannosidase